MDRYNVYYDLEIMIRGALTTKGLDEMAVKRFVLECEAFQLEILRPWVTVGL